ncbi:MAG TPA: hypothetical protein PKI32_10535, partial [Opitutales bacterium]|nr:hypothetical protein [Opitutales bacterium]
LALTSIFSWSARVGPLPSSIPAPPTGSVVRDQPRHLCPAVHADRHVERLLQSASEVETHCRRRSFQEMLRRE